jgi:hypothetical protein
VIGELLLDAFAGPGGWGHGARQLGLADVGLELEPAVCATRAAAGLAHTLAALGLRLHGFGVKTLGLTGANGVEAGYAGALASADSLAWSEHARHAARKLCSSVHPRGAASCANYPPYALGWRARLLADLAEQQRRPRQLRLDFTAGADRPRATVPAGDPPGGGW